MEWKDLVGTVAPWIATALGGPLGGMAVGAVADALGLSDKTEASIKQALSGVSPEQLLAIKTADMTFAIRMQELGFENLKDMEQLASADRDSARHREIEVKDNTPRILAYLITSGFFGILTFMMLATIPSESRDILNIMLGTLGANFSGVCGYYFGSTAGSRVKSELLAKATIN